MSRTGGGFRPAVETLECLGARIEIVDPEGVLRGVDRAPASLLHGDGFPPPLLGIDLAVSRGEEHGQQVLRFRGDIQVQGPAPERDPELAGDIGAAVAPAVGALLFGGAAALPLAGAVLGTGLYRARRRRSGQAMIQDGDDGAGDRAGTSEDPDAGLTMTVTYGPPRRNGRQTHTAVATVPAADAALAHLRAFVELVFDVARRQAGGADDPRFYADRAYVVSRYPGGRWAEARSDELLGLDRLGGLDEVVRQLREVAVSFKHPETMARWGARRPQGILLYGPPGTGKTTLAKALAVEIGGTVREVRTPDILDKWVGNSERNLKRIFAEARRVRTPTVLLFDEFDSIISYTGQAADAASQSINALAGIFKQEMNTLVTDNPNVIVVATTNFPERVDESLIRAGRFDVKLAVPLPDAAARADILVKLFRQLVARHEIGGFRLLADDVDVHELADLAPGMTGADLTELLRRVQLAKAMEEALGNSAVAPITSEDLKRSLAGMRQGSW